MNDEIREILENIKCPQLGYNEYGKWGALPLNVRMTLKRLCDYVVSCDDYITNLQNENEEIKVENEKLTQLWLNSQEKRRKAIEYLEQPYRDNFDYSKAELLNILQNGSEVDYE